MTRYIPIIAGVLLIVGLTIAQGIMSDRLAESNITAEQQAELLKLVPNNFGDWHGEDKDVDKEVKEKAGSVGTAVSRNYRNSRTGERVDLWLIVGHARDISSHTPDICYPGSGFEARGKENGLYPLVVNGKDSTFWTNTFYREDVTGRHLLRVFWTWFKPGSDENEGRVVWEAPQNARWRFGNSRALYKMYFTSEMRDTMETPEQSACIHFARDFLPEVEKALTQVHTDAPAAGESSSVASGEKPQTDDNASGAASSIAKDSDPATPDDSSASGAAPATEGEDKADSSPPGDEK